MKIAVTLNLLGYQSLDIKQGEMALELAQGTTVAALIGLIDEQNPGFKAALFDAGGNLSKQFVFFINGRNAVHLSGASTILSPGDVVNVIPAIAGG